MPTLREAVVSPLIAAIQVELERLVYRFAVPLDSHDAFHAAFGVEHV